MAPENPWLQRRILAYAHQGGAWEFPSSTLFSIEQALSVGATAIELDVHAAADGELFVCHDATVDRTTNGSGAIAELTSSQLVELDNAYWFVPGTDVTVGAHPSAYPYRGRAPAEREFGIATLREVLERFPGVILNLDIKRTAPAVQPYEATLASLLAEFERTDDVIVASFFDAATTAFRAHAPQVPTSAGSQAVASFWQALQAGDEPPTLQAAAFQVPERFGGLVVVDERFVAEAHRRGIAVHVWTVNDQESMQRFLDLGVDGIMTDVPTQLSSVLAGRPSS